MDSKTEKYLDRVIGSLVRGTNIDYEKGIITFPFSPYPLSFNLTLPFKYIPPSLSFSFSVPTYSFEIYCKNTYGLTEEEIKYVYKQYRDIIKDKIENGQ